MNKEKKINHLFWWILTISFIIFISLYIAMGSGYYEAQMQQRTTLTKENIEKFEQDIKEGKPVDINDYVGKEKKDYNNAISKAGISFSDNVEKFMKHGIGNIVNFVGKLFGA